MGRTAGQYSKITGNHAGDLKHTFQDDWQRSVAMACQEPDLSPAAESPAAFHAQQCPRTAGHGYAGDLKHTFQDDWQHSLALACQARLAACQERLAACQEGLAACQEQDLSPAAESPAAFHAQQCPRTAHAQQCPRTDDHDGPDSPPWPFKLALPALVSDVDQVSTAPPDDSQNISSDEDDLLSDVDVLPPWVTTLTVKNLPSRTTPVDLMQAWACDGRYDFLYLPFTAKRGRPSGYAFINFTSNFAAAAFYRQWHSNHLRKGMATRKLNITISTTQGFQQNLQHCATLAQEHLLRKYAPVLFGPTGSRVNPIWVMQTLQYMASINKEKNKNEEHQS